MASPTPTTRTLTGRPSGTTADAHQLHVQHELHSVGKGNRPTTPTGGHTNPPTGAASHSPFAKAGLGQGGVTVTRKPGTGKVDAHQAHLAHLKNNPSGGRGKPLDAHQLHQQHEANLKGKLTAAPTPDAHQLHLAHLANTAKKSAAKTSGGLGGSGTPPSSSPPSYSGPGGLASVGGGIFSQTLGSFTHVLVLIGGALLLWYLVTHRKSITRSVKGGA